MRDFNPGDQERQVPGWPLEQVPSRPLGNPYQYNNPGKHGAYDVICYGADGREGGEGGDKDICNDNDVKDKKQVAADLRSSSWWPCSRSWPSSPARRA